ncbi:hypothetical protein GCM10019059_33850 [Camelimonas fluminis]|nr:hypothetical protein GCM10019059_33850 [Camelimonas fluminis]
MGALVGLAGKTGLALSAVLDQRADDMIAHGEFTHIGADFLDDARQLMAQHRREGDAKIVFREMKVGMAKARGLYFNQNLTPPGRVNLNVLHIKYSIDCIEYSRLHFHARSPDIIVGAC